MLKYAVRLLAVGSLVILSGNTMASSKRQLLEKKIAQAGKSVTRTSIQTSQSPDQGGGHDGHTGSSLQQGRYTGYIQMQGREEIIALQADFFVEAPDDFTQFPKLEAIVKVSLGGYNSTEYMTYSFRHLKYNYENGTALTLDEPSNDLVFSIQIHTMEGRTHMSGQVWSRSSSLNGVLNLLSVVANPQPGDTSPIDTTEPFSPLLDGQYVGKCDGKEAIFQLQAVRGLKSETSEETKDLFDYEIVGRVGYKMTGARSKPAWETYASFAGGSYDPYRGNLVFLGPSSTSIECSRHQDSLSCQYRTQSGRVRCEFKREVAKIREESLFPREHHVTPTSDQNQDVVMDGSLPDSKLASIVGGHFSGYLHHEAHDRYQRVDLHVVSSVSTENPHNPNKVFVSTTAMMYYGSPSDGHFMSQRYEPTSYYVRPGFTLNAPGTDSFIVIEEWKTGFIRGVWYSESFGRVGTIELVKAQPPSLPASAKVFPSWKGEFEGLSGTTGEGDKRWFHIILPNLPAERSESTIPFVGSYQSLVKLTRVEPIESGSFDPYTGAVGWSFDANEGRAIVSGQISDDGGLLMYWPPTPNVFSASMSDYKLMPFKKVN